MERWPSSEDGCKSRSRQNRILARMRSEESSNDRASGGGRTYVWLDPQEQREKKTCGLRRRRVSVCVRRFADGDSQTMTTEAHLDLCACGFVSVHLQQCRPGLQQCTSDVRGGGEGVGTWFRRVAVGATLAAAEEGFRHDACQSASTATKQWIARGWNRHCRAEKGRFGVYPPVSSKMAGVLQRVRRGQELTCIG